MAKRSKTTWDVVGCDADVRVVEARATEYDVIVKSYEEAKAVALEKLKSHIRPYLARIDELESDHFLKRGALEGRRVLTEMKLLQELLAAVPPGPIQEHTKLDKALADCWDGFRGSGEGGMEGYKLLGRMESVGWHSPVLSFVIERHGGTVKGSTRAELQHWEINLHDQTACIIKEGHRQLEAMAPRVSVKAIAEEIAGLILSGMNDTRIRRQDDGSVKIVLSKIFPSGSGFKRTVTSRRKRLLEHVRDDLAEMGWVMVGGDGFRLP